VHLAKEGLKMNKKILLTTIFIFIITNMSFYSSIGQTNIFLNDNDQNYVIDDHNLDELPIWSINDFWEYDLLLNFAGLLDLEVLRMEAVVTDISDEYYTLTFHGYLDKVELGGYNYANLMSALYLDGTAQIEKSTLAMKVFNFNLSGCYNGIIRIDFNIQLKMEFHNPLEFLKFPIIIGNSWNIGSDFNFTITGHVRQNGEDIFIINEKSLKNSINDQLIIEKTEIIGVPAGNFESYLISGNLGNPSEIWYSPEIGFLVKVRQYIPKFLTIYIPINFGCYINLISTNFNYPDDNSAPIIPVISGPSSGKPKTEYDYTITTTDPDEEQIYYKMDWGDGDVTEWLGPFDSGVGVQTSHKFKEKSIFKIRAKAMDINGYQTPWTDLFIVTMPRNRYIEKIFFFRFFEQFPLLSKLLNHLW
jgi:hypothetical protein